MKSINTLRELIELTTKIDDFKFYDGTQHFIDTKRMIEFEKKAVMEKYFNKENIIAKDLIETLGPFQFDFTNMMEWSTNIPDINPKSARLFCLWVEDINTKKVVAILRGYIFLISFDWSLSSVDDYFEVKDHDIPYYPYIVISSFRNIFTTYKEIEDLVLASKKAIQKHWKSLRIKVINQLPKNSDLWNRYVASVEELISISILFPSFDLKLQNVLKELNFTTSSVFQLASSPTKTFNKAMIKDHLSQVKKFKKDLL